jgi:hypothetical protein
MKRIPLKGGHEADTFSRWRRVLCSFKRPGQAKQSKRTYNKRFRKEGKVDGRDIDTQK